MLIKIKAEFLLCMLAMLANGVCSRFCQRSAASDESDVQHNERICWEPHCVTLASEIMNSIDPHKDPCEDFYQYACNGWIEKHPVPKDEIGVDHWSLLTKEVDKFIGDAIEDDELRKKYENITGVSKAFDFYDSCMNVQDKLLPIKNNRLIAILKEYLPWPIVDPDWNDTDVDISRLIGRVTRDFDGNSFFKAFVETDLKNSSVYMITVKQTFAWGLFATQLSRDSNSTRKSRAIYKDLIYNVSLLLGATDQQQLKKDAQEILDTEMALAKTGKGYGDFDEEIYYGKYKVSELQGKTKDFKIDWLVLFNELLSNQNYKVTQDQEIIVTDMDVIIKTMNISVGSLSKRAILNYIGWRVVEQIYKYGSQQLDDLSINFRIKGLNLLAFNKKDNCKHNTKENFADSLSRIYIDKKFPKKSKELAKELAESIQEVFKETLKNSEWMDDKSKAAAAEKADAVKGNYGYPDYILDDAKFDASMKYITVTKDSLLDTMVSIGKNNKKKELSNLGKPINRNRWTESPLLVNPHYFPMLNTVTFPAAYLQPPFYDANYLRAVSYGGVGAVIAHEFLHGFDSTGKDYDKDGNNVKWWTDLTLARYKNRTRCLVDQYNKYTFGGFPVDGERTLPENIGDNVGVRESFKAYQRWVKRNGEEPSLPGLFNNEQLFFLSYARNWCKNIPPFMYENEVFGMHSPSPLRVNGPLQNFAEFSKVFKCPTGSAMNPIKKCSTW